MTDLRSRLALAAILFLSISLIVGGVLPARPLSVRQSPAQLSKKALKRRLVHPPSLDLLHEEELNHRWHQDQLKDLGVTASPLVASTDVGDIAVLEDDGTIIVQPNSFDLNQKAIMFAPGPTPGYQVSSAPFSFDNNLGTKLNNFIGSEAPRDDGYQQVSFTGGFTFPYYGRRYADVFVGTNGFLTFGSGDADFDGFHESVLQFLRRQPRIAAFWHDLDPGVAQPGHGVFVKQLSDRLVVTWDTVPEFTAGLPTSVNTFQITLFADGNTTFAYDRIGSTGGLVGLSPGDSNAKINRIDLTNPPAGNLQGAILEFFSTSRQVDLFALSQSFYKTHRDDFDFLYLWTNFDFDIAPGFPAFAAYLPLLNDVRGINTSILDVSGQAGSAGKLQGMLIMGSIDKSYPNSPAAPIPDLTLPILGGTFNALGVMGQENAHRWLARVRFKDGDKVSSSLLGRSEAHWSFFLNTESTISTASNPGSSALEGNLWRQGGPRSFSTPRGELSEGYSPLDQYLMGLRSPEEVPDLFVIENPSPANVQAIFLALLGFLTPPAPPLPNIGVNGDRKNVSVRDIIAVEGPRLPDAGHSQKQFREAFVLLVQSATQPSQPTLDKLNLYRTSWEQHFLRATDNRALIRTNLRD